MHLKFYYCKHCGKIVTLVNDSKVPTICCGDIMAEIIPGTTEGVTEKHLPSIKVEGNMVTVTIGSELHPSLPEHYIQWIVLQTDRGTQAKKLNPGDKPQVEFALLPKENVKAAYEYCNIHKLWKSDFSSPKDA